MTNESRPRPADQVVFRDLDQGAVVLHLGSGEYHGLNRAGVLIWGLLDGRRLDEIVAAVRERVQEAPAELDGQVRAFVDGLAQRGLVTA
jgi:hypothetical protein